MDKTQIKKLSYIIGAAIGDGNLSNSNGRAVRLRITCDNKYPDIIKKITEDISIILPTNKVSLIKRTGCIDVSCYSNKWEKLLGWKALNGSKEKQKICIPKWIFEDKKYIRNCLLGLFQTDGSIYKDRKYTYVNFTTIIPSLLKDTQKMIEVLGYKPNIQKSKQKNNKIKYVIRISKNTKAFIKEIKLWKK